MITERIQEGFEVFVSDADNPFGAVRQAPSHGNRELVVYVENAGDFTVGLNTVKAVHAQKSSSTATSSISACGGRAQAVALARDIAGQAKPRSGQHSGIPPPKVHPGCATPARRRRSLRCAARLSPCDIGFGPQSHSTFPWLINLPHRLL